METFSDTTARLRRTFHYPDDDTTETSTTPDAMDEEGT
jgi:hypothetical protein